MRLRGPESKTGIRLARPSERVSQVPTRVLHSASSRTWAAPPIWGGASWAGCRHEAEKEAGPARSSRLDVAAVAGSVPFRTVRAGPTRAFERDGLRLVNRQRAVSASGGAPTSHRLRSRPGGSEPAAARASPSWH